MSAKRKPGLEHVYVGPSTPWGLQKGSRCRITHKVTQAPGVCRIETASGAKFLVPRKLVEKA